MKNTRKIRIATFALLSFTGFSLTGAAHAQGNPFETELIAPDVYSFGAVGAYSMFVVTADAVVVADPVNPEHAAAMLESIAAITPLPVRFVIYSHDHWDHISGGQVFKDAGATIISHADTRASLLERPNPDVVVPDFGWNGSRRDITVGGTVFEMHHFGPSHGRGMTVIRLPAQRVLFTVDLIRPTTVGFGILPDYQPSEWIRTLGEIDKLDFDIATMGHKGHSTPRATVAEHRQYLLDLDAAIQAAIDAGQRPWNIPDTIELPQYADWDRYDEFLALNAWRFVAEKVLGW